MNRVEVRRIQRISSVTIQVSASVMISFGRWEKLRECEMRDVGGRV